MALLNNGSGVLSANGNSTAVKHPGGELFCGFAGTFGGGSASIQVSFDEGTTWISLGADATKTSAAVFSATSLPDCYVRVSLTGATSPTLSYFLSIRKAV